MPEGLSACLAELLNRLVSALWGALWPAVKSLARTGLCGFVSGSDETLHETSNETSRATTAATGTATHRATADGLSPDFRSALHPTFIQAPEPSPRLGYGCRQARCRQGEKKARPASVPASIAPGRPICRTPAASCPACGGWCGPARSLSSWARSGPRRACCCPPVSRSASLRGLTVSPGVACLLQ